MLTGLILAHLFNSEFLATSYKFAFEIANELIDFRRSSRAITKNAVIRGDFLVFHP